MSQLGRYCLANGIDEVALSGYWGILIPDSAFTDHANAVLSLKSIKPGLKITGVFGRQQNIDWVMEYQLLQTTICV